MLWILGTYGNTRRLYIVLQTGLGSNNFRYLRLTWTRSDSGHGTRSERAFTYHCCGTPFIVSTNLQRHEEGGWIERAPYLLKIPDLPGARLRPFNPRILPSTWVAVWRGVRIQKNQLRVKTHRFEEFGRKESAQRDSEPIKDRSQKSLPVLANAENWALCVSTNLRTRVSTAQ
jgi:hypothetical protein